MKKIEAYQTTDGKKFLEKEIAENHQDRLKYERNGERIKNYLSDLLELEELNSDEDGATREEEFCNMIKDEFGDLSIRELGIVEFLRGLTTFSDGALLKTAGYAKKII